MQRSIISVAVAVLCTGWMIFPVQPAAAQAQPPTPQARPSTSNISDQKLDQTAAAIQNVQRVRADYQQKLSAAAPNDQNKIMSEANAALEKAVTDQGLSVDEYQSIIQVAQNDPNVHQRLAQRLSANKTK
jgi:uncharacterized protein DUF4168